MTTQLRGRTPEEDRELGCFTEGIIRSVDTRSDEEWTVVLESGTGCIVPSGQWEPKVGDTFTIFGTLGFPFYGQELNGALLWYDSPEQEVAKREADRAALIAKRKREFAESLAQLDADFDSLPESFQRRISRFRSEDPDFRWRSEAYEMFCCKQAVLLAEWARSDGSTGSEAVERVRVWSEDSVAAQMASIPGWSDEHSGNTFWGSVSLASALLRGDEV